MHAGPKMQYHILNTIFIEGIMRDRVERSGRHLHHRRHLQQQECPPVHSMQCNTWIPTVQYFH